MPIVLDHRQVLELLPARAAEAHKGDFGRILLLCGSRGYTGAAALAAMGALRSGAGLVYLGVPESIYAIEAVKLTEAIVFPLPEEQGGYAPAAVEEILPLLDRMDAVLCGPGMGQSAGAAAMVQALCSRFSGPLVLDADGINLLSKHKDVLRHRQAPVVLTPHAGEFARLCPELQGERTEMAAEAARQLRCVLLLKGHETVITDGEKCYVNHTGNSGMAVGGSGDLLSGMIVSLLGQGMAPLEAAACAAWLHGKAGDVCAEQFGQRGLLPSDMASVLGRLME